jgi:hypothetical protein
MIKYTSVKKLAPTQRTPRQQQNEFWSDQMRSIQSMDNVGFEKNLTCFAKSVGCYPSGASQFNSAFGSH